jgi:hypothetical protein
MIGRREYKYIINEDTAEQVRRYIGGFCKRDDHAERTGGSYTCDTLYFDTMNYRLHRAAQEKSAVRYKVRIRGYANSAGPVFLEVKHRIADCIAKSRAAISGDWVALLQGEMSIEQVNKKERPALESFLARYHTTYGGPVFPTVLVRYQREPYSSLVDEYARVTFDREIRYQPTTELSMVPSSDCWIAVDDPPAMRNRPSESGVVLELKFTDPVPNWLRNLVTSIELPRLSFSKYGRAIDSMMIPSLARRSF